MRTSEVMTYPLPEPISRTLCVMVGKWLGVRDGRGEGGGRMSGEYIQLTERVVVQSMSRHVLSTHLQVESYPANVK